MGIRASLAVIALAAIVMAPACGEPGGGGAIGVSAPAGGLGGAATMSTGGGGTGKGAAGGSTAGASGKGTGGAGDGGTGGPCVPATTCFSATCPHGFQTCKPDGTFGLCGCSAAAGSGGSGGASGSGGGSGGGKGGAGGVCVVGAPCMSGDCTVTHQQCNLDGTFGSCLGSMCGTVGVGGGGSAGSDSGGAGSGGVSGLSGGAGGLGGGGGNGSACVDGTQTCNADGTFGACLACSACPALEFITGAACTTPGSCCVGYDQQCLSVCNCDTATLDYSCVHAWCPGNGGASGSDGSTCVPTAPCKMGACAAGASGGGGG